MSERPKIWIHRTRRFWVGLGILVFLVSLFITSSFLRAEASFQRDEPDPSVGYGNISHQVSSSFKDGGFTFFMMTGPFPDTPHDGFDLVLEPDSQPHGIRWWPTFANYEIAWSVALPLWPLPVLWAIFWITRMVRAERRELKKFSEDPPQTDREL